jgi:hypothetical protein
MKNKFVLEIIVSLALISLAVLLLNPLHFWMPNMLVIGMLAVGFVLFGILASFILREAAFDERDMVNRSLAGRNAFLIGAAVLMLGILIQGYTHTVDPWLVITLIAMILVKIGTRLWNDKDL